jgi:hypothetical protein
MVGSAVGRVPPIKRSNSSDAAAFETSHASPFHRLRALRDGRPDASSNLQPHRGPIRRARVSADPKVASSPPEPLTKAPFFSLRNVPLWVCLVQAAVVAGIIALVPHP